MFFVRRCPGCGEPARLVCPSCLAGLEWWDGGRRGPSGSAPPAATLGLDGLSVLFAYDALARRVVLAAKNGGRRDLLAMLGRLLAAAPGLVAGAAGPAGPPFDLVTWVPASRRQARRRGYDQGRILASAAGRALEIPAGGVLTRSRREAQAGRSRADRLIGPQLRAHQRCRGRVLLVDDVTTTGASLAAAAAALRGAGAGSVHGAVLAAKP